MYSGRRFVGSRRVKYGGTVLRPSGEPSRVLKRKKDTPRIFQSVFHLILNFDLFVSGKTGLFEGIFICVVYALMGNLESVEFRVFYGVIRYF